MGTSQAYGFRSATYPLAADSYSQAVHTTLYGLTPGVKYHWRIVAVTAAGTGMGHDRSVVL